MTRCNHLHRSLRRTAGLAALAALAFTTLAAAAAEARAQPDLRVSAIRPAAPGLCAGDENRIRVSITNSQLAGVSQDIPVILSVSQPPHQPSSYVSHREGGIGPRTTAGQPVWFDDVVIPDTGRVTLQAVVNPDQEIQESNYRNNTLRRSFTVNRHCGQAQQPPAGATLTVNAFVEGTWQAGQGTPVPGAQVNVTCGSFSGSEVTGDDGKASFESVPSGSCASIAVSHPSYESTSRSYNMPSYDANVNIGLSASSSATFGAASAPSAPSGSSGSSGGAFDIQAELVQQGALFCQGGPGPGGFDYCEPLEVSIRFTNIGSAPSDKPYRVSLSRFNGPRATGRAVRHGGSGALETIPVLQPGQSVTLTWSGRTQVPPNGYTFRPNYSPALNDANNDNHRITETFEVVLQN